ncbi:hypothetical protein ABT304_22230 [Nocardioides sp. NPDC000445]|uniref:hypothetical protein n=1 Tax=Nocardioides sp. NPDC000445 TaxID=3154257 RepID=UPI003330175D
MGSTSDREHEKVSPHPPRGRRVVWAAKRPTFEGVPWALPGVVVEDLPDGWTFVSWLDKDGWYCPDAVYQVKDLRVVSDAEFEDLVRTVRDSPRWNGVPHDDVGESKPSPFRVGDLVQWVGPVPGDDDWDPYYGPWRQGQVVPWVQGQAAYDYASGLTRNHPGRVVELRGLVRAPRVRWIDKDGEFEGRSGLSHSDLEAVDEAEAERLATRLRQSDWPGFVVMHKESL